MHFVIELMNNYGYIILFSALLLELIAFPLPGELIMTYCGFLVYQSKMNWIVSIFIATSGVVIGITIAYFFGSKLGAKFFKKYGSYVHLGPKQLEKTSKWFNSWGNILLISAYFIPGVRHITGYFSGITEISYKRFALNAYFGALIWTSTFISLGRVLGPDWGKFHSYISEYLLIGSLSISLIFIIIYAYRNHKTQIINSTYKILNKTIITFHSMGRMKVAVAVVAAAFLMLDLLVIGVVHDYLVDEFDQFNVVVSFLVNIIFTKRWSYLISYFDLITSFKLLLPLTILILIWIIKKNRNIFLEIQFIFIVIGGGEMLQVILKNIFKRVGPSSISLIENSRYTFPSSESLMAVVAYGFFAFLIGSNVKRVWTKTAVLIVTLIICLFAGINPIYSQTEYPSDVYAGYIFGGIWLTINIILLEVYRILPKIQINEISKKFPRQ
ncbi:VTT domain-containing protein [Clostridium algoriphilum]|uniref:VTT domain-containing protein n=1 Tax=Clostridium algoriphilum TaxID=198347 RepID=UPI001CF58564|nr:VTT domain-containing protein [Clostridium algoriphilum]MCB2295688.1 VTT domain-containing protein [Clostridium algoriphilum]